MAARNFRASSLPILKKLSEVGYADGSQDSVRKFLRANTELHVHVAHLSGNRRLVQLMTQLLLESERLTNFGMVSYPHSEQAVDEHKKLLEALTDKNSDWARRIMEEHVKTTREMIVESLITNTSLREIPIGV
jgi:DNA-binding GntR family transcriptional regulator